MKDPLQQALLSENYLLASQIVDAEGLELCGDFLVDLAKNGRKKVIKWLHQQGLDLNVKLSAEDTLLNVALRYGQESLVLWLLSEETTVDFNCLFAAVLSDNVFLVSQLLDKIDINSLHPKKGYAIQLALSSTMITFLLQHGFHSKYNYLSSLKPWLHVGYHLNEDFFYSQLCQYINSEIARNRFITYRRLTRLLQEVPYHESLMNCQDLEFIRDVYSLEDSLSNKILDEEKQITSLMIACYRGDLETVRRMCKTTLNINALDVNGNSCLHFAVYSNNFEELKKLLLDAGIDSTLKNKIGVTAFDLQQS